MTKLELKPGRRRLTENQRLVLDFCRRAVKQGRPFPRHPDIAKYMGWPYAQSAVDCMRRLERLGYLRQQGYKPGRAGGGIIWELVE